MTAAEARRRNALYRTEFVEPLRRSFDPFWRGMAKWLEQHPRGSVTRVWKGGRIVARLPLGAWERIRGLDGGS